MPLGGSSTTLSERLKNYLRLVRADKPVGAALLMWPMLWTLWFVSDGQPKLSVFVVFVIGTFLMRSAGCAINDFADRKIDGAVERSRDRPIVTGAVSPKDAVIVAVVLSLVSFALVLTMNRLTIALSFIGVVLAFIYPFSKRYTYWPQLFLGAAFGWAVPMVSAAQTGAILPIAWPMYGVAIIWALAYDTIYAMVDRPDDLKLGVKSTAILFAERDVAIVMVLQIFVIVAVTVAGLYFGLRWIFLLSIVAAAALLFRQWQLIRDRDRAQCFRAFLLNNHMGAIIFVGIALNYWMLGVSSV